MIVSHKYKFVFIHVGKTGGDAVVRALAPYCGLNDIVRETKDLGKHARASVIMKYFEQQGWEWKKYFSFLFLRNPWEIIHSDYWYHRLKGLRLSKEPDQRTPDYHEAMKCWRSRAQSFKDFVAEHHNWKVSFLRHYGQTDRGQDIVSKVYLYQDGLDAGLRDMCLRVGHPLIKPVLFNATSQVIPGKGRPHPREDFTPFLIEKVARDHAHDIERFRFKFEDAR